MTEPSDNIYETTIPQLISHDTQQPLNSIFVNGIMQAKTSNTPIISNSIEVHAVFFDIESYIHNRIMERWVRYGIINGDAEGGYRSHDVITRAELAAIISRLIGYQSMEAPVPYDISVDDWFYNDIMRLMSADVLRGSNNLVRPHDPVTREEAIVIISRAFRISGSIVIDDTFDDWDDISGWAKEAVASMSRSGYLDLFGNTLYPEQEITRIETIMILDTIVGEYYNQAGTYCERINGNVIIRSPNVRLVNAYIDGDVYIVDGVDDGYYTIDDSTVIRGSVYIFAGKSNPYLHIDPTAPMVALTYDDGPTPTTLRILNVLEEYDARATFFVVGNRVGMYTDTLSMILDAGSEIGGHSWAHAPLTTLGVQNVITDTERVINAIYEATGYRTNIMRPPYGDYNSSILSALESLGVTAVNWSIDPQDWLHMNANTTYSRIMNTIHDGAIVLMHDIVSSSATATEWLVPELIENGYQLVTVTELLTFSDIGILPGRLYNSRTIYR